MTNGTFFLNCNKNKIICKCKNNSEIIRILVLRFNIRIIQKLINLGQKSSYIFNKRIEI